jgi:hypothetical protein
MFSAITGYLILEPERFLKADSVPSQRVLDRQQPTLCSHARLGD